MAKERQPAAKTAAEASSSPIRTEAYYDVVVDRAVNFRSITYSPQQNPHLMSGELLNSLFEVESPDAISSISEISADDLKRRGVSLE